MWTDDELDVPEDRRKVERFARMAMMLVAIIGLIGLYFVVSEDDYKEQVSAEERICAMVEQGYYPAKQFPYCEEGEK